MQHIAHRMYTECIRFLFPPQCPGCGKSDTYICSSCQNSLTPTPIQVNATTTSLFQYHNPLIKRMLWLLKYRNKYSIAHIFGRYLSDSIMEHAAEDALFVGADIYVVPMPMSIQNQHQRGKNHARLIAEAIIRTNNTLTLGDKCMLTKIKETKRQATIHTKSLRLKNLKNSMSAAGVQGKTIILIDDVTTTGASIQEAMRALKQAGARHIRAYVIAH